MFCGEVWLIAKRGQTFFLSLAEFKSLLTQYSRFVPLSARHGYLSTSLSTVNLPGFTWDCASQQPYPVPDKPPNKKQSVAYKWTT